MIHLTYCMNVHPGESLPDMRAAVAEHAVRVKAAVSPDAPFGLGLRIADAASRELADRAVLEAFREDLSARGLYAFTINGFPYGAFHGARVKERVYAPDWRDGERIAYTLRLAGALAALLPDGVSGSISTVPGGYKPAMRTPADVSAVARGLADAAAGLAALEDRTGREIHLGLEPEPDCLLETTDDTVSFFARELASEGGRRLREKHGYSRSRALSLLGRHIGVCLDTCHAAVAFEDPTVVLERLSAAGIRISKIQLSAAPLLEAGRFSADTLKPFANPVYLSQVRIRCQDGAIARFPDLPQALEGASPAQRGGEWRVHCHVPLYFEGSETLRSTASLLTPAFFGALRRHDVSHLELETYTFHVLPEALRGADVVDSVVREFQWANLRRYS